MIHLLHVSRQRPHGARRWRWAAWAAIGLGATVASHASGQSDGERPPPPPQQQAHGEEGQPFDFNPERLRTRLATLLEELEASTTRIRSAIETLDNGGTAAEAMETMGGPSRVRRLAEFWGQWSGGSQTDGRVDRFNPERGPRGGQGERGPDRAPAPGDDVSAAQLSAFLESHAPEFAARLDELRQQDERRADFFANRLRPRIGEILAAQRQDPELGELLTREFRVNMELLDAGRRYAKALASGDSSLDEAREKLRALAGEQVDLRLARREHEIRTLASQIESLQADVDQQREKREQYIEQIIERSGQWGESERSGGPERRGPRDGRPGRSDDD
ncbi:MAG: hypothetical protein ACF8R9_13970 [Phycisphaerales bacterium JB054]